MSNASQTNSRIQIRILPVEEEDDDLETLGLVEEVHAEFLAAMSSLQIYTVEQIGDQTRGGGFIVLVAKIVHGISTRKDLIIQLLKTSQPVIDNLSKRKHIQTIDVTVGDKSIHIGNATEAQSNWALGIFQAAVLKEELHITPLDAVKITATITKDEPPAIAERSVTDQNK